MTKATSPRYVTFYKVMLILSTIGTALATINLVSLPTAIAEFNQSPIFGVTALFNVVILAASILALVLLWQKKKFGYQLKISTYIASIVVTLISLFGASSYSKYAADQAIAETPEITESMAQLVRTITEVTLYVGIAFSIAISVTFLLLWRAAWKRQSEADADNGGHKKHRS